MTVELAKGTLSSTRTRSDSAATSRGCEFGSWFENIRYKELDEKLKAVPNFKEEKPGGIIYSSQSICVFESRRI
jgi:hypothetical protein